MCVCVCACCEEKAVGVIGGEQAGAVSEDGLRSVPL